MIIKYYAKYRKKRNESYLALFTFTYIIFHCSVCPKSDRCFENMNQY